MNKIHLQKIKLLNNFLRENNIVITSEVDWVDQCSAQSEINIKMDGVNYGYGNNLNKWIVDVIANNETEEQAISIIYDFYSLNEELVRKLTNTPFNDTRELFFRVGEGKLFDAYIGECENGDSYDQAIQQCVDKLFYEDILILSEKCGIDITNYSH